MSHGPNSTYQVIIASNATTSAELDMGRVWKKVYLAPNSCGAEVRMLACESSGGTFKSVYLPQPATSTVQANLWKVATGVSGGVIEIAAGFRYMKFTVTATAANGTTFVVYGAD